MMQREEFVRRLDEARQEESRLSVVWLIFFFAVLFGQVPLAFLWVDGQSPWFAVAHIVGLFAFLFGNLWLVLWYYRNRAGRFGLLCSNCGAKLHGVAGEFVLQACRCPKCGIGVCER